MSLVAYDNSDESDEEVTEEKPCNTVQEKQTITPNRKSKEPVKITIPSLNEFEDEDGADEAPSKKPKLGGHSGLLGLLPPPKHSATSSTASFKPHILTKKKEPIKKPINTVKKTPILTEESKDAQDVENDNYDFSKANEDDVPVKDFFSLEDNFQPEEPLMEEKVCLSESIVSDPAPVVPEIPMVEEPVVETVPEAVDSAVPDGYFESGTEAQQQPSLLDNEGFLKLHGKKRRELENINFIDIKADDQLTDRTEWMMKSLTEEQAHQSSRKRGCMPTAQQRRKHQITYLAFQAKEREMDLKNQWALNSRTRRETQAKYGF